jgi:hypothetical protein
MTPTPPARWSMTRTVCMGGVAGLLAATLAGDWAWGIALSTFVGLLVGGSAASTHEGSIP